MEVGVAKPKAHGHAITNTAIALNIESSQFPVSKPEIKKVNNPIITTIGTNIELTLSTSFWIGAFFACASSTSRIIFESKVSLPTASVVTLINPLPFILPAVTKSPMDFSIGKLSPVIKDSSTWLSPSIIFPSIGIFSPGFT